MANPIVKLLDKYNIGGYPKEFNAKVHGPYDPAIFYGKRDIPLAEVKMNELGSWLRRRNKSPRAMVQAISRAYWRWNHKYVLPKYSGIAPIAQVVVASAIFFYTINITKLRIHGKQAKYHW